MKLSKKAMKIGNIALIIVLLTTTIVFAYNWWTTKEIPMSAYISTVLDLGLYMDSGCTIPFTSYDWGEYGAGVKNVTIYLKNLGNDIGYYTWNMSGTGWTLQVTGPYNDYYYYSDNKFNFTICWGDPPFDISHAFYPDGTPQCEYRSLNPGEVTHYTMYCWTSHYLAYSSSWTVFFHFYDNLA